MSTTEGRRRFWWYLSSYRDRQRVCVVDTNIKLILDTPSCYEDKRSQAGHADCSKDVMTTIVLILRQLLSALQAHKEERERERGVVVSGKGG